MRPLVPRSAADVGNMDVVAWLLDALEIFPASLLHVASSFWHRVGQLDLNRQNRGRVAETAFGIAINALVSTQ